MSEFRQNPFTGQWVVMAANRAERPSDFRPSPAQKTGAICPFCRGHEGDTPEHLLAVSKGLAPASLADWDLRVIPNKYPALTTSPPPASANGVAGERLPGWGSQEVIIESAAHRTSTSELSNEEAEALFLVYQLRMKAAAKIQGAKHVVIFKNVGPGAGATIEHGHSQLVVLPHVPQNIVRETQRLGEHRQSRGSDLWEEVLAAELRAGSRILAAGEHVVALCPYAARWPYEIWLVPREPQPDYRAERERVVRECGRLMREMVARLERAARPTSYNYLLFSGPLNVAADSPFRWRVELFPRLTVPAGFEWGAECWMNPVPPEISAVALRAVGQGLP